MLSPLLTGHKEPWDAPPGYYIGSLFVAGFLLAVIHPEKFYLCPLGVIGGQIIIPTPSVLESAFGPLGWVFVFVFGVVCWAGAVVGFILVKSIKKLKSGR